MSTGHWRERCAAPPAWDRTPAGERAALLEAAADLYEGRKTELMALIVREGGRTIPDALSEVREAVDYLRYYALRTRADFAGPMPLPGPAGERNEIDIARARRLRLHLAVEFPAGDLHRPDRRGARRRQCGHRQARRADAADRRRRGAAAARGGDPRRGPPSAAGDRRGGRRARSSPTHASPGSSLPARPRPRAISTSNWRAVPGRSCRSSPRPAGRMR